MTVEKGTVLSWRRTFTDEDVLRFGELTGDQGNHHIHPDEKGKLMVQGLLTASIATKIGGDMNYIAREMTNEYIRPVFTGDTITCEVTITDVEQLDGFKRIHMEAVYKNQWKKEVLKAKSRGIIRN